jgi:hypothetical protein
MMLRNIALLSAACATASAGQPIVVNTLHDTDDFAGARQMTDLPGPDGKVSFREAVTASNNTPGPNTIHFAIPQNEWWLVSDYALLRLEDGVFLISDDATTVDFSTQAAFTGDTNPNGREVGIYGLQPNGWGIPAIIIQASDCVIRGLGTVHLRGAAVAVWSGGNNRFVGNHTTTIELDPYPGTTTGNIIGGTDPADGNDLGGVQILCGANDNVVLGNRINSVSVTGSSYCTDGNRYPTGNRIGGPTPAERNVINDFGSYGSEGFPSGSGVRVEYARDTLVEGNYIGVTADGMDRVVQRGTAGVRVADAFDTTIRGNLISGVRVVGINHAAGQIFGTAIDVTALNADNDGVIIENNRIGTDATGENPITTRAGVTVQPTTFLRTVRNVRLAGNTIAFTELDGVRVGNPVQGVDISGNSIHSNTLLGIDLLPPNGGGGSPSGVTPNDPGDSDNGANGLQNFPILAGAGFDGATAAISGTLGSRPNRAYRVELFASPEADPSGHGEGRVYLGSAVVTTDSAGEAPFAVDLDASEIEDGWIATATATDTATAETSEFGPALSFSVSQPCLADFNADGTVNFFDIADFIDAFNTQDPATDLDDNGQSNFFDVAAFIDAYNAGCP